MNLEAHKRRALRQYFKPSSPAGAALLLVVGIGLLLAGLAGEGGQAFLGLIATIAGALWLKYHYAGIPSDRQVDQWLEEDMQRITERSVNKLGLEAIPLIRDPIPIRAPIYWETPGVAIADLQWKRGKDNIVRFAVYDVLILQFSEQILGAYECTFNFLRNEIMNDETDEFHYKDINSVSTHEEKTEYISPTGERFDRTQTFRIAVAGEDIRIPLPAKKLAELTKGTIPDTAAERAVSAIRLMLREKKV